MPTNCFRRLLYTGALLSLLFAPGCAKNDPKQQVHKAEKEVEVFLDAWSRGEPPDKFAAADGPLQGTDPDWQAGYRLLSFLSAESKPNPEISDRIRCRVSLSLKDKQGTQSEKDVVYEVSLGEKTVIKRASP